MEATRKLACRLLLLHGEKRMDSNSRYVRAVPLPECEPVYVLPNIRLAPANRLVARRWSAEENSLWFQWTFACFLGSAFGALAASLLVYWPWEWLFSAIG